MEASLDAKIGDQTPRLEETATLRDPNDIISPNHITNQEMTPSHGVGNLRPKHVLVPSSGDKIPDNKPTTLKRSEKREGNRLCLFPSTSLYFPALGQAKRGRLSKPAETE